VLLPAGVCPGGTGLSAQSMAPALAVHIAGPIERFVPAAASPGPSPPVGIDIAAIDVHTTIGSVGRTPAGATEVPAPGPGYGVPGWYRYSPTPRRPGSGGDRRPPGFAARRARGVLPARRTDARSAGGDPPRRRPHRGLEITAVAWYAKRVFPTAAVFGDLDHAGPRLITCGGPIDPATGHYRDNTVVFATLVATRGP
jgi:hypothetical protein